MGNTEAEYVFSSKGEISPQSSQMYVKMLTNLVLLREKLEFLFDNRSSSASASKTILTGDVSQNTFRFSLR
jgi:hypothetical protein